MKKLVAYFLFTLFSIGFLSVEVKADGFDAGYYAAKYPDVVAELGTDPGALYQHYLTYGKNEGRFQNQQEETESYQMSVAFEAPMIIQELPYGGTYIDIDIANQTLTYYVDGEVALSSPCVTGNVSTGNDTPTGVYSVMTHTPGKYLTGPTWNVWVDRWMRFTPGAAIGIHDASWRSNFGGDIYQTNGSHGCVNLPHDAACQLFDMACIGTTVVVH
ncbi:MAG: L,D-transpeptidase [Butyrivibrio sp.]|nr:L,D-transpeptidase [Butyrivibrio sp.]